MIRVPLRLLAVTGTRADFGLWLPVLEAARQAGTEPRLLVTAMHLDERFGRTVEEVRASAFPIAAEVPSTAVGDSFADMSISLGRSICGLTPVIERERPDWLMVLGDRGEQLAAALAALHLSVPVAHLHGGERTAGAVDDILRDLISRIAELHFVATAQAYDRLIEIGVAPGSITRSGAPGLDAIRSRRTDQDRRIQAEYGVAHGRYLLLVQHPETRNGEDAVVQLKATLGAVREIDMNTIAVFANADAGGRAMGEMLSEVESARFRTYRSIAHADYLALLSGAAALVGNSSSAIIEAPLLGVPAVNVGRRQSGRERGDNVIDVPAEPELIRAALERALSSEFRQRLSHTSPYGDGHAAPRIVERVLAAKR